MKITNNIFFRKNYLSLSRYFALFIFCGLSCLVHGQEASKKNLTEADFEGWSSLSIHDISDDGDWVSYHLRYDGGEDSLFIKATKKDVTYAIPRGAHGVFKDNYYAGQTPGGVSLIDLRHGKRTWFAGATHFNYSKDSQFFICHGDIKERKNQLLIKNLKTDKEIYFNDVREYAVNPMLNKIAIAVYSPEKSIDKVEVISLGKDEITLSTSNSGTFEKLIWQENGESLIFAERSEEMKSVVKIYKADFQFKYPKLNVFDLLKRKDFPGNSEISISFGAPLSISKDGQRVFFGIREKISARDENAVQIWKSDDQWIYPRKEGVGDWSGVPKVAVWWPKKNTFVPLGTKKFPKVVLSYANNNGIAYNPMDYGPEFTFIPTIDFSKVNFNNGKKKQISKRQLNGLSEVSISPDGSYLAFYKERDWFLYDFKKESIKNLTKNVQVDFQNQQYDDAGAKPSYGYFGWTDSGFLVYDQFDVWRLPVDGKKATRLTNGRKDAISYRIYDKLEEKKNIGQPYNPRPMLSLKDGMILKGSDKFHRSGFFKWSKEKTTPIVFEAKQIDQFRKADGKKIYVYREQDFNAPPKVMMRNNNTEKLIFQSNPQYRKFFWGHSKLIEYQNKNGENLLGALFYPANYNPDKKYPMITEVYEQKSSDVHTFVNPSFHMLEGFNLTGFSSQGYFILHPDIVYTLGEPGASAVDCVVSAINKVKSKGIVEDDKIGLIGHSFGGYETDFIITQTDLFATAIAGSAATDLNSWYFTVDHNSLRTNIFRFEDFQWRIGASFFQDQERYFRNSPLHQAKYINTPLLAWSGNQDFNVHWTQSIEFYLALRRLNKTSTLLMYPNEPHQLMKNENQKDLYFKMKDWFGYYLKNKPKAPWMLSNKL